MNMFCSKFCGCSVPQGCGLVADCNSSVNHTYQRNEVSSCCYSSLSTYYCWCTMSRTLLKYVDLTVPLEF